MNRGKVLKVVFLIGAVLMFTVSCIIIWKTWEKKTIQNKGIEVVAIVLEAPKTCEDLGRRPPYSKLEYNNKVFVKKVSNDICHLVSNKETVNMLTNEDGSKLLFTNEYDPMQFIYGFLLLVISIVITIRMMFGNGNVIK